MTLLQLTDDIYAKIAALCKQGDNFMQVGNYSDARKKYIEALRLLPEDHKNWDASTWIYTAIGDTHFRERNFDKALKCLSNAIQCPKGVGNPYIHLRLGQLLFEQNNLDKAADELTRAYMGAGIDIFMEDDPKYLEFLETRIEIERK